MDVTFENHFAALTNFSAAGWDWGNWSAMMLHGPLNEDGPLGIRILSNPFVANDLGSKGPLSNHWYNTIFPCLNSFSHHSMLGGVFHILGPLGPLGALGKSIPRSHKTTFLSCRPFGTTWTNWCSWF